MIISTPCIPPLLGELLGWGGHPQTPSKGALPLVESPFSYFMVLMATSSWRIP